MNALTASCVSKKIRGTTVLRDINLALDGGKIYAFQGENGSGKTMLFRVLSGLSLPTTGTVCYNGKMKGELAQNDLNIGITLEGASLYPSFTGIQNLSYLAQINHTVEIADIRETLYRVGLDPEDRRTVRKYSLGMKQRLLIAQAVMERPDFLFLDEPTNAIDKNGVQMVYDIIKQEAARGAVVLLASHADQDISILADVCYQMEEGRISQ